MPYDDWDYKEAAQRLGVDTEYAENINADAVKLAKLSDESNLSANDLYYLMVAAAIRLAKLAGAPSDQLRTKFESALKRTEESLPS